MAEHIDTSHSAQTDGELQDLPGPRRATRTHDPLRHTDLVRTSVTIGILLLLIALLLLPLISIIAGWVTWGEIQGFVTLVWGGIIGLAASAVGYYFGSERSQR